MTAVSIANGMKTGFYECRALVSRSVRSVFHLSTFTSNFSLLLLLVRWFIAMVVLHRYYYRALTGRAECQTVGIGCLSSARGFKLLSFLLLPRLRSSLGAFFTAGCFLSGDQMPFGEAWFAIYPGIVEVVLFVYALLNLLSKLLHRRMSDVLFGPSLFALCGLHYFRQEIAAARWFGIDGRVNSVMSTAEYGALQLQDFFSSDAALRLNGNIKTMLILKLMVLSVNALPILVSVTTSSRSARIQRLQPSQMEKAMEIRVCTSSGLGCCTVSPGKAPPSLPAYELVRIGYVIVGEMVVMAVGDWIVLAFWTLLSRRVATVRVLTIPIPSREYVRPMDADGHHGDHHNGSLVPRLRFVSVSDSMWTTTTGQAVWNISAHPIH